MVFSLKVENAFKEELEWLFHYARMADDRGITNTCKFG